MMPIRQPSRLRTATGSRAIGFGTGLVLLALTGTAAGAQTNLVTVGVSPSSVVVGNSVSVSAQVSSGYYFASDVTFRLFDPNGALQASRTVPANPGGGSASTTLGVPSSAPTGAYTAVACGVVQAILFSVPDEPISVQAQVSQTCGSAPLQVQPVSVTVAASDALVGSPVNAAVSSNASVAVRVDLAGPGYVSPTQSGSVQAGSSTTFSFPTDGLTPGNYQVRACRDGPTTSCSPGTYTASLVINCRPLTRDISLSTNRDQAVSATTSSLLAPGCAPLDPVPEVLTQPANGAASADGAGVRYTPNAGFEGVDSFAVQVCVSRPQACSARTIVTVEVNTSPVAADATLTVVSNGTVSFDVRDFSSDADGSVVGWSATAAPAFGTLTNSGATTGAFNAPGGRCGASTSFAFFVVDDDGSESNRATVTVSIVGCPVATDVEFEAAAGQSVPFEVSGTDPDGTLVDWQVVTQPELGSVEPSGGLGGEFTAPDGSCGQETAFEFRVVDDDGSASGVATATVMIVGCPTLRPDPVDDGDDGFVSIDVLANDDFPGGVDPDSVTIVDQPTGGSVSVVAGRIEYRAQADFAGTDEFAYEACDVFGQCGTALISVVVAYECEMRDDGTVAIEPSTANAGDEVNVTVTVPADGVDVRCTALTTNLILNGAPWGPALTLERTGASAGGAPALLLASIGFVSAQAEPVDAFVGETSRVIPIDLVPGDHKVDLIEVGSDRTIGSGALVIPSVAVGDPDDGGEGMVPGVVWGAGAGLAALAGAGFVFFAGQRRRRHAGDPCPGERRRVSDAEEDVAAARSRLADAESRLESEESTLAGLESELEGCADTSESGGPIMPVMRRQEEDDVVVSEHRLAGVSNPHAPVAVGHVTGWWSPRETAVDAVLVCDVAQVGLNSAAPADDLVEALATMQSPFAAHVLVTPDGVTGLLPDDVSVSGPSRPGALVVVVSDPTDPRVQALAAGVVRTWMKRYELEPEAVSAGVVDGTPSAVDVSGLLAGEGSDARLLGAVPLGVGAGADPCAELRKRAEAQRADVEAIRGEVAEARAELEAAETRAAEEAESLRECECRPAAVAGEPEEAAPEDDSEESKWFLLKHPNPKAPLRTNQKRGWYHPSRKEPVSGIVVHTAEAINGPGTALYLSTVGRPASAHVIADATGIIKLLPDSYTAFHAAGGNSRGLGIEIEYFADNWGTNPTLEDALLRTASIWCGMKAAAYGIPARRVTPEEWAAGERGFIAHGDLDPSRRRDPGRDFPWDEFLRRVAAFSGSGSVAD